MTLVLAIDQGGQSSRALVLDAAGGVVAEARRPVGESRPTAERVEQDPEELVRSVEEAIREAVSGLGARAIARAGLATQRSSIACWDRASGAALSPVLSWQDRRAAQRMRPLEARRDEVRRLTGLFPSAHYGASKLAWCLAELPAVAGARAAGRLACGPLASFLAYRLTRGPPRERALFADPANASRTLLWNVKTRDWEPALLAAFGVPREVLPDCAPTRHRFGTLDPARTGCGAPLAIVQGDQPAALFAWGEPRADTVYVNLGTGAFVQRPVEGEPPELERLLASVVYADERGAQSAVEGTVNGAGSALAWLARREGVADLQPQLGAWLAAARDPPLFLNGVSGLGSPFWGELEPRFVGAGDRAARAAAVVESIVFLVQENLACMQRVLAPPRAIVASGGLARLDGLCQRLADLSGVPVERPDGREATARGLGHLLGAQALEGGGAVFDPRADAGLARRHARWRSELERGLANGGSA